MQLPTINLNGTSKNDLFADYYVAYTAIDNALNVLGKAAPHGRDYPSGNYSEARLEHNARVQKLNSVREDLYNICIHLRPENG